jgi:hypothetical protein
MMLAEHGRLPGKLTRRPRFRRLPASGLHCIRSPHIQLGIPTFNWGIEDTGRTGYTSSIGNRLGPRLLASSPAPRIPSAISAAKGMPLALISDSAGA